MLSSIAYSEPALNSSYERWREKFDHFMESRELSSGVHLGYNMWDIKEIQRWDEYKNLVNVTSGEEEGCKFFINKLTKGEVGDAFLSFVVCDRNGWDPVKVLDENGQAGDLWCLPSAVVAKMEKLKWNN